MWRENNAKDLIRSRYDVSHETFGKLEQYVDLLRHWQRKINLVSPTTLDEIWTRHILDSVQIFALKPSAKRWLDLGSGGGLPGLVIGCLLGDEGGTSITLVESNGKKGAFLRHVAAELNLPVRVIVDRIEDVIPTLEQPEVVTARALASLDQLLRFTNLLLKKGTVALFPKGRDHEEELTAAAVHWHFLAQRHASVTDPSARILEVSMGAA